MTVAELIEKLKAMPQDLPVTISVEDSDRGGPICNYVEYVGIQERKYTGKFDVESQKGIYERAVCIE